MRFVQYETSAWYSVRRPVVTSGMLLQHVANLQQENLQLQVRMRPARIKDKSLAWQYKTRAVQYSLYRKGPA